MLAAVFLLVSEQPCSSREWHRSVFDADGNQVENWEEVDDPDEALGRTNRVRFLFDDLDPTGLPRAVGVIREEVDDISRPDSVLSLQAFLNGLRVEAEVVVDPVVGDSESALHLIHDGHGSVRLALDESGAIVGSRSWEGFGGVVEKEGGAELYHGFAGELVDSSAQRVQTPSRTYSPALGRFLSADPLEGRVGDPSSHHRYVYAAGNPILNADPTGRETLVGLMANVGVRVSMAARTAAQIGQVYLRARSTLDTLEALEEAYQILQVVAFEGVDGLGEEGVEAAGEMARKSLEGLAWRIAQNLVARKLPGLGRIDASFTSDPGRLGMVRVGGRSLGDIWHASSFSKTSHSIAYHLAKHGKGRTATQYTSDAMKFFHANKRLGEKVVLKDGSPGIKVLLKQRHPVTGKAYKLGGYWTEDGRLVTFWD